ncbi:PREDICTED: uncharacterized protein LOC108449540 isoform X2 [Corvus brachyrhynchos]|uniref:uncharacterized protein LOC108449540 isoform X2 n=1 Tax=Corvus brachyrhynchos TaxID=85066 RepID=UPI0008166D7C|nr:PREDICTED: uncharacterized protein LOC108449540 isoform X2 [Corvus brachyrhynchos]
MEPPHSGRLAGAARSGSACCCAKWRLASCFDFQLEVFEWGLLDLLAVPRKNKNWIYSSVNSESMLEEDVLKFEEGDRLSHSKLQWF